MMRRLSLILLLLATPALAQSRAAPKSFTQDDLKRAESARDAAVVRVGRSAPEEGDSRAAVIDVQVITRYSGGGRAGWQFVAGASRRVGDLWLGAYAKLDDVSGSAFDGSPLIQKTPAAEPSAGLGCA